MHKPKEDLTLQVGSQCSDQSGILLVPDLFNLLARFSKDRTFYSSVCKPQNLIFDYLMAPQIF